MATGAEDLAVSAFDEPVDRRLRAGRVYVFRGPNGQHIATFESPLPEEGKFGTAVAGIGDTNGNGRSDLVIASEFETAATLDEAGRVDLFRAPAPTNAPTSQRSALVTLHGNVPNPFNPRASIRLELARGAKAQLGVFDLRGRHVRSLASGFYEAGSHLANWDGTDRFGQPASSGSYFFRLRAGEDQITR